MRSEYVKETVIVEKSESDKEKELMGTIMKTKKKIKEAADNYQYAEGKLIDYFLYTMKAEQAKLDYLIARAKAQGLTFDLMDNAKVRNEG